VTATIGILFILAGFYFASTYGNCQHRLNGAEICALLLMLVGSIITALGVASSFLEVLK